MRADSSSASIGRRVTIVTPAYISSTPRVVREADALSAAGFDVRVVFSQGQLESLREFDRELLASKPWRSAAFKWSNQRPEESWAYYRSGVRHRLAQAVPFGGLRVPGLAERAEGRVYPELTAVAASEPAELFIGHYPVGLAAASHAARRHQAAVGYDVEDLYADAFQDSRDWARTRTRILELEDRYVGDCAYVSAVSQPVADAFAERRRACVPIVLHNCCPWSDRQGLDGQTKERTGAELSLFWFSQTVGLERGLQDAIAAAGLMSNPAHLHLVGALSADTRASLSQLALDCGVAAAIHFHEPVRPDELLSRAVEHDVGLALEPGFSKNNALTASNKLFTYMTAGLAIAATDVPGQKGIIDLAPTAGRLYEPGDFRSLAGTLDAWSRDRASLAAAKRAALDAARTVWNWERESQRLVAEVTRVVAAHGEMRHCG